MSRMFSVVTLASDSGPAGRILRSRKPGLCGGSPGGMNHPDDLRSLPKSDRVYAEVGTYSTGKVKQNEPAKKNWPISAKL